MAMMKMDSQIQVAKNPESLPLRERLFEDVQNWVLTCKKNIDDSFKEVLGKIINLYETPNFCENFDLAFVRNEILSVLTKEIGQLKVTKKVLKEDTPYSNILKLKEGDPCFAKWNEDGVVYNAIIQKCTEDGTVEVLFSDYGNVDYVRLDNVFLHRHEIPIEAELDENLKEHAVKTEEDTFDEPSHVIVEDTIVNNNFTDQSYKDEIDTEVQPCFVPAGGKDLLTKNEVELGEPSLIQEIKKESPTMTGSNASHSNITSMKSGDNVVARWSDDVWYNAEILTLDQNGFLVRFTDYGNEDLVSSNLVFKDKLQIPVDELLDEHLLGDEAMGDNCPANLFEVQTPKTLQCSLCGHLAKRCMRVICDNVLVCWGCGVKKINIDRKCWVCHKVNIRSEEHLVKDLELRNIIDKVTFTRNEQLPPIDEESNIVPVQENNEDLSHSHIENHDEKLESISQVNDVPHDLNHNQDTVKMVHSKFHVGEKCFAKWVDEVYYNAEVLEINPRNTVVVLFTDYGNVDEVFEDCVFKSVKDIPAGFELDVNIREEENINNAEKIVLPAMNIVPADSHNSGSEDSGLPLDPKYNFLSICGLLKGNVVIDDLSGPVGVSLLHDNTLAVVCRNDNTVLKLSRDGDRLGVIQSRRPYLRPTDIFVLESGEFLIRDAKGIQIFSKEGLAAYSIGEKYVNNYVGITEDEEHIITINRNSGTDRSIGRLTKQGETDLFLFDKISKNLVKRVELVDVIEAAKTDSNKSSACGSLYYDSINRKLFVTDSGLGLVYCFYDQDGEDGAGVFGDYGPASLSKPSGLVMDDHGNMIIVDSGTNRLLLVDSNWNLHGSLKVDAPLRKPSGIYFDKDARELFVCNYEAGSLITYKL